jgi:hypothetical protein
MTDTIAPEIGKFYRTRDGFCTGAVEPAPEGHLAKFKVWIPGTGMRLYNANGTHYYLNVDLDLVAEWTDADEPKIATAAVGQYEGDHAAAEAVSRHAGDPAWSPDGRVLLADAVSQQERNAEEPTGYPRKPGAEDMTWVELADADDEPSVKVGAEPGPYDKLIGAILQPPKGVEAPDSRWAAQVIEAGWDGISDFSTDNMTVKSYEIRTTHVPPVLAIEHGKLTLSVTADEHTIVAEIGDGAWFFGRLVELLVNPALRTAAAVRELVSKND